MVPLSIKQHRDEAEMRAFFVACGFSNATIEAAIEVRRNYPHDPRPPNPLKGKKRAQSRIK
jgi:hypothetical protein